MHFAFFLLQPQSFQTIGMQFNILKWYHRFWIIVIVKALHARTGYTNLIEWKMSCVAISGSIPTHMNSNTLEWTWAVLGGTKTGTATMDSMIMNINANLHRFKKIYRYFCLIPIMVARICLKISNTKHSQACFRVICWFRYKTCTSNTINVIIEFAA